MSHRNDVQVIRPDSWADIKENLGGSLVGCIHCCRLKNNEETECGGCGRPYTTLKELRRRMAEGTLRIVPKTGLMNETRRHVAPE